MRVGGSAWWWRAVPVVGLVVAGCGGGDDAPRWLALGDSYSSGEGTEASQGRCGRSAGAYAPLAAAAAGDVEVVHLACSGARVADVVEQLAEATADGDRFDVVTLTAGGNDAGYADVLSDCIGVDDVLDRIGDALDGDDGDDGDGAVEELLRACDVTAEELGARVDDVGPRVAELLDAVDDALADGGRVVVVGYPHLFESPARWGADEGDRCDGLGRDDVETLRAVAEQLDAGLRAAVEGRAGVEYLSLLETFTGHGRCSDDPWLNGLVVRPRVLGSFHPNDEGHRAVADALTALVEG